MRKILAAVAASSALVLTGCGAGNLPVPFPTERATSETAGASAMPTDGDRLLAIVEYVRSLSDKGQVSSFSVDKNSAGANVSNADGSGVELVATYFSGEQDWVSDMSGVAEEMPAGQWDTFDLAADYDRMMGLLEGCDEPTVSWEVAHNGETILSATCGYQTITPVHAEFMGEDFSTFEPSSTAAGAARGE